VSAARAFIHARELVAMACDRHAYTSAQQILVLVEGEDRTCAEGQLRAGLPSLSSNRYGRKVLASLEELQASGAAAVGGA